MLRLHKGTIQPRVILQLAILWSAVCLVLVHGTRATSVIRFLSRVTSRTAIGQVATAEFIAEGQFDSDSATTAATAVGRVAISAGSVEVAVTLTLINR